MIVVSFLLKEKERKKVFGHTHKEIYFLIIKKKLIKKNN